MMSTGQTFKTDGKLDIAGTDDVLNLEVGKLGVETKLLDNASVLARGQLRIVFGLGTSDNHLARSKDESSGLGVSDSHDDSSKPLEGKLACH